MSLRSIIDKVAINKLGYALTLIGGLSPITLGIFSSISERNIDLPNACGIFLGTFVLGVSTSLIKKQNESYDRLVATIEQKGYDSRLCSPYMGEPCDRSLVRTVLKRTGHFDRYEELEEERKVV